MTVKDRFVFVILHYITMDDTIKCVNSIQKCCLGNNFDIIIVDNASPNGSGKKLKDKYERMGIKVILSDTNLGFARANNLGFRYAKEKLRADFIILCNNDTQILSKNFCYLVKKRYDETGFAVLGPKENLPGGKIHSLELKLKDPKKIRKQMRIQKLAIEHYWLNRADITLRKSAKKVLKRLGLRRGRPADPNEEHRGIVLHGAFLVFSKVYIDKFDGLDERTFLYDEESFLQLRLQRNGMLSLYAPEVEIFHNLSSSMKRSVGSRKKAIQFFAKHDNESLKILLEELENDNKKVR